MSQCKCGATVTFAKAPDAFGTDGSGSISLESFETTTGERYVLDFDEPGDRPMAEPIDPVSSVSGHPPHAPSCPLQST